jgi:hypothetical protein
MSTPPLDRVVGFWQLEELRTAGFTVTLQSATRATISGAGVYLEVHLADADESECVDYVVCADEGYFLDDVVARCSDCGAAIVYRPTAPRRPPKVCARCAALRLATGARES